MSDAASEPGQVNVPWRAFLRRYAADLVSILGVLPIGLLVLGPPLLRLFA